MTDTSKKYFILYGVGSKLYYSAVEYSAHVTITDFHIIKCDNTRNRCEGGRRRRRLEYSIPAQHMAKPMVYDERKKTMSVAMAIGKQLTI